MDAEGVEGTAPPFKATSFDGSEVAINAAMDKKLYVINFWATWCPPCRAEMPELNEFAKKHEGEVTFYAVNLQEDAAPVQKFMQERKADLPVVLDTKGAAATLYGVRAIPTTVVVDKEGKIVFRKTGGVTKEELEDVINHL